MDENNNMMPPPQPRQENGGSSMGMIIGAIVVLAVIIFGALYFMRGAGDGRLFNEQMNAIETQSTSDETAGIEADLNSTNIENVDYNLNEENFTSS